MIAFVDIHAKGCNCSYCGDGHLKPMHYGLNIPPNWRGHNAWYVVKFGPRHYWRMAHGLRLRSPSTRGQREESK